MDKEDFNFVVDSALLSELGEKLVSTVQVALAELIKNSYDADATVVNVRITPQATGAASVVIEDDGCGMLLGEVRAHWMKIGTTNKADAPVSATFGRLKTGSKGVGRFACRRLGTHLKLTTRARMPGATFRLQETIVDFDWLSFAPGTEVEKIDCRGRSGVVAHGKTGTTLEIWGGEVDEWQVRGFHFLQRQLAVLANNRGNAQPGFKIDPGFNVVLAAPGLSEHAVDLRETIMEGSWGTLTAEVDQQGRALCTLVAKGLRGKKEFKSKPLFCQIGGAKLKLGILPLSKDEARKPAILAQYVIKDIADQWGGVQLRYNGFRMFPYGDRNDDWLGIDFDRGRRLGRPTDDLFDFASTLAGVNPQRSLLNMLSMRSYVGQVELTSQIKGLSPRIDRQGFVDNGVITEVRDFARFAIDWANIHREHYVRMRQTEAAEESRRAINQVVNLDGPGEKFVPKAAKYLRDEIKRIVQRLPPTQREETEQTLVRTVRAIETSSKESYQQLQHLRLVASASTLTLLFAHEVNTVIGALSAASARLDQLARTMPAQKGPLGEISSQLRETKQRFDNLTEMTGIVGAFRKTDVLVRPNLKDAIERAVQCFQLVISRYDISVDYSSVPGHIQLGLLLEGELYTILLNILSNAVKSTIASGNEKRAISFDAQERGQRVVIHVSDNGVGIDEQYFDEVFTPFISDPSGELYDRLESRANPEDASIFGTGSGLGLSIARDVARSRRGDISFVAPGPGWNACIEVELP